MRVGDIGSARIPAENLRVDPAEFSRLWAQAQTRTDHTAGCDAFSAGVLATCRWLAGAVHHPEAGAWFRAPAPITARSAAAMPESITAECLAADMAAAAQDPAASAFDVERIAGIQATFNWAWRGTGPKPEARA